MNKPLSQKVNKPLSPFIAKITKRKSDLSRTEEATREKNRVNRKCVRRESSGWEILVQWLDEDARIMAFIGRKVDRTRTIRTFPYIVLSVIVIRLVPPLTACYCGSPFLTWAKKEQEEHEGTKGPCLPLPSGISSQNRSCGPWKETAMNLTKRHTVASSSSSFGASFCRLLRLVYNVFLPYQFYLFFRVPLDRDRWFRAGSRGLHASLQDRHVHLKRSSVLRATESFSEIPRVKRVYFRIDVSASHEECACKFHPSSKERLYSTFYVSRNSSLKLYNTRIMSLSSDLTIGYSVEARFSR